MVTGCLQVVENSSEEQQEKYYPGSHGRPIAGATNKHANAESVPHSNRGACWFGYLV